MKTAQKTTKSGLIKEVKSGFESLGDDFLADTKNTAQDTLSDFNSQFFGENPFRRENLGALSEEKKEPKRIRRSEIVFNYMERREESRLNEEIKHLMKEVKKEIEMLRVQDQGLVQDISKLTVNELPQAPGIYHLRFLEFIVKLLQTIRKKISEGRLWLQTSFDKKRQKKFWKMAKSKGTKFSMSKELSQANLPG